MSLSAEAVHFKALQRDSSDSSDIFISRRSDQFCTGRLRRRRIYSMFFSIIPGGHSDSAAAGLPAVACRAIRRDFIPPSRSAACESDAALELPESILLACQSATRPRAATRRRTGHSLERAFCAGISDWSCVHMPGQISMGNGADNIDGGIIALNLSKAACVLNSGHSYFDVHRLQRTAATARRSKQHSAVVRVSDIDAL